MKKKPYFAHALASVLLLIAAGCSVSPENEGLLQVENAGGKRIELTRKELGNIPRASVTATDKSGNTSRYEGVKLVDVLRGANAPFGDALRGEKMTGSVVVEGADGYKVTFTLAELDPDFSNKTVLLADKRDGEPLSEDEGKLRLVVPDETKRQARWVRQVVKLSLRD